MRIKPIQAVVLVLLSAVWICQGIQVGSSEEDLTATEIGPEGSNNTVGAGGLSTSGRVSLRPAKTRVSSSSKSQLNRKFGRGVTLFNRNSTGIVTTEEPSVSGDIASTTPGLTTTTFQNITIPGLTISLVKTELHASMDVQSLVASGGSKIFELIEAAFLKST
ncbi:unnamed protein product [Allacma fusca]|uniref:Uncharacterized protein n=1 Tax=Allacma fusca TaxID=39272 RepID=A0A8J2LJI9_9HEXA|nr:unnamed protein product [Allacma fusca]